MRGERKRRIGKVVKEPTTAPAVLESFAFLDLCVQRHAVG